MPIWLGVGSLVLGGIGAINQNKASKKAAEQQVQSADQGLALQERIYSEQKAGMQPYAQAGQQALGSLGSLMGFPALPPNAGAVGRDANGQPLGPIGPNQPPMNMSDPGVQHLAAGGSLVNRPGTLGSAMTQSSYGQQGTTQGAMLKMRAPDGEVADVPADQADHFLKLGAQRVG